MGRGRLASIPALGLALGLAACVAGGEPVGRAGGEPAATLGDAPVVTVKGAPVVTVKGAAAARAGGGLAARAGYVPPIADAALMRTPDLDAGDRKRGERYFYERIFGGCGVCHTLVQHRKWIGSSLQGIFGRRAGTMEGFVYSRAMRESGIVWDAELIDRLIQNPRAFLPGTRMYFKGLPGPQHAQIRRDIIAFLKEATR